MSDIFVERRIPTSINGKPWTDRTANDTWRAWQKSLFTSNVQVEDGDNFDSILKRADTALAYLEKRPEESVLVVPLGHFIKMLVARALLGGGLTGTTLARFYKLVFMENTGITVFIFNEAFEEDFCWRVWSSSDHTHFAE